MTTHASGIDSATSAPRLAGRSSVRLIEVNCPRSTIYQQNRLQTMLQVRLRQLEYERQATLARIAHSQRQLQQRFTAKSDRRRVAHCERLYNSYLDEQHVSQPENDNDVETSKCLCDCCRYGLWTGKIKPAGALDDTESTTPARLSRSVTICPVIKSRGTAPVRYYDNKRFSVNVNAGALRRSKTIV